MNKSDTDEVLKTFWKNNPHPNDIMEFTSYLVNGTMKNLNQIDKVIENTSKNWSFRRINAVDLGILREAIFEILFCQDIPCKVTLNEAIELGKKFGTEKSGTFINGVLDNVVNQDPEVENHKAIHDGLIVPPKRENPKPRKSRNSSPPKSGYK